MRAVLRLMVVVLCVSPFVRTASGENLLRTTVKTFSVNSRMVARVPLQKMSSLGLNHESFIVEFDSDIKKSAAPRLVKLSYRFHAREAKLPSSFLDYRLVHRFRVTRDESCDESWGALTTRYLFDKTGSYRGSQNSLVYASNAPEPQLDPDTVLPCYVVTPHDYESSKSTALRSAKDASARPWAEPAAAGKVTAAR